MFFKYEKYSEFLYINIIIAAYIINATNISNSNFRSKLETVIYFFINTPNTI